VPENVDAVDMDGHGHVAETIKCNFVLPNQGYLRQRSLLQLCGLRYKEKPDFNVDHCF